MSLGGAGASAASPTKVVILDTVGNRVDGVLLISGSSQNHVGIAKFKLLPALQAKLGPAKIFSSTICSMKLPVTVAQWHDLSVAFESGKFALLVYNYGGWSVAFRKTLALPPVATSVTPLVETDFGVTVGDSVARVKKLDPKIRGFSPYLFAIGSFTTLNLAKRIGAKGGTDLIYQVAQLELATGNC